MSNRVSFFKNTLKLSLSQEIKIPEKQIAYTFSDMFLLLDNLFLTFLFLHLNGQLFLLSIKMCVIDKTAYTQYS